jgi:hypothetical protein
VTRPAALAFDLRALPTDFYEDPFPYYHALRREDPVHRCPDGSYFLTRYDDVVAVYQDHHRFSSDKRVEFAPKFGETPLYEHHTTSVVFRDPPDHTRIRKLFAPAFTPKALAALETRVPPGVRRRRGAPGALAPPSSGRAGSLAERGPSASRGSKPKVMCRPVRFACGPPGRVAPRSADGGASPRRGRRPASREPGSPRRSRGP